MKKYIIETVKQMIADGQVAQDVAEKYFPELKESEDEKWIPKEIAKYLKEKGGFRSCWIAWLEKQGEQKPAGKVGPMFHEGDWIVNNNSGSVYQVTEIRDDEYCLWPIYSEIMGYLRIIDVDNEYHLWNITQDAKAGDVLYSREHNLLFLYYTKEQCHIAINLNYSDNISVGSDIVIPKDTCPATKEQCDLLFSKMKKEGYKWDADYKELKKIKPKHRKHIKKI